MNRKTNGKKLKKRQWSNKPRKPRACKTCASFQIIQNTAWCSAKCEQTDGAACNQYAGKYKEPPKKARKKKKWSKQNRRTLAMLK